MKLEQEVATLNVSAASDLNSAEPSSPTIEDARARTAQLVRDGIREAKAGNLPAARQSLQQAVYLDKQHETALMWLASISDKPIDLLGYLQEVLRVNPANERAAQWAKSTKAMLAKSLIQQGAASHKEGMPEIAEQYFLQAVEYEPTNETAWLWLVSVSNEPEDKLSYLNRILLLNPAHEKALALFHRVKTQIARALIEKAGVAARSGDLAAAREILSDVTDYNPNLEEAWLLKAALAESNHEKIACFERVLEINAENETAQVNLLALRAEELPAEQESNFADEQPTELLNSNIEFADQANVESIEEPADEFADEFVPASEAANVSTDDFSQQSFAEAAPKFSEETIVAAQATADEPEFARQVSPEVEREQLFGGEPRVELASVESTNFAAQPEFAAAQSAAENAAVAADFHVAAAVAPDFAAPAENAEPNHEPNAAANASQFAQPIEETVAEAAPVEENEENVVEAAPAFAVNCQFCEVENSSLDARCGGCGAFVRLVDFEALLDNEMTDESRVRDFIEKCSGRELTGEECFNLALAYLNLRNAKKALGHFETALRANHENAEQNRQINNLLDYLREKMPEIFGAAATSGKTILVVDDSPTVRKLIAGKLEKHGHAVVAAVDGMDALSKLNETVPDLILLDVTMPRLDGYQLCKLVKANQKTKHVPVVMISGKDGFFDKVRGRMAGSTAYITKPFGPETLLQTVDAYCK